MKTKKGWTTHEQMFLQRLYREGYSAGEMAALLSRSLDSVNKALGRYQIRALYSKTQGTKELTLRIGSSLLEESFCWPAPSKAGLCRTWVSENALLRPKAWVLSIPFSYKKGPSPMAPTARPGPSNALQWFTKCYHHRVVKMTVDKDPFYKIIFAPSYKGYKIMGKEELLFLINQYRNKLKLTPFQGQDIF